MKYEWNGRFLVVQGDEKNFGSHFHVLVFPPGCHPGPVESGLETSMVLCDGTLDFLRAKRTLIKLWPHIVADAQTSPNAAEFVRVVRSGGTPTPKRKIPPPKPRRI